MRRWTAGRKVAVIEIIRSGWMKRADALKLHDLSPEELAHWEALYDAHGRPGLRATKLHFYRNRKEVRSKNSPVTSEPQGRGAVPDASSSSFER